MVRALEEQAHAAARATGRGLVKEAAFAPETEARVNWWRRLNLPLNESRVLSLVSCWKHFSRAKPLFLP